MRSAALAVAAVATIGVLAGCSSGQQDPPTAAASTTSTPVAATSDAPPQATTTAAGGGGTATAACTSGDVAVTVPASDDAGAGHVWYVVTAKNTSAKPCTIHGFPGVSMVSEEEGQQVGAAAKRFSTGAPVVTLQPGEETTAPLQYTQAGNYPDSCQITPSAGFRVYLPDQTTASFARQQLKACANGAIVLLEISPFGTSP